MTTEASTATRNGNVNKQGVADALVRQGFVCIGNGLKRTKTVHYNGALESVKNAFPTSVFLETVVLCQSIHEGTFKSHLFLYKKSWPHPVALFCFHQGTSGSTDDKLPYFYDNLIDRSPCPGMFILEGPSFVDGVFRYGEERAKASGGKILRFFRGTERFEFDWLMKGSPYPTPEQRLF